MLVYTYYSLVAVLLDYSRSWPRVEDCIRFMLTMLTTHVYRIQVE
jgi:hypothetical protein